MSVDIFAISVFGSGLFHQTSFLQFISCDYLTLNPIALIDSNSQIFLIADDRVAVCWLLHLFYSQKVFVGRGERKGWYAAGMYLDSHWGCSCDVRCMEWKQESGRSLRALWGAGFLDFKREGTNEFQALWNRGWRCSVKSWGADCRSLCPQYRPFLPLTGSAQTPSGT